MTDARALALGRALYPVTDLLGPGPRLVIWLAGCTLHCPGCMTPELWDVRPEQRWPWPRVRAWVERLPAEVRAVTVSGGEPFQQADALAGLLRLLRARGVEDVWVYTGYRYETLREHHPWLSELIDVLIDGPYRADQPTDLIWRGSANQRLHLLTPRARTLHARWVDHRVEQPRLRLVPRPQGPPLVIGIPRAGDWERLRGLTRPGLR